MKFGQDIDYWVHKTKAYLHDPPDKAVHIPGHVERADDLLAATGLSGSTLSKEEYQQADIIASGMDRATLPGYVENDEYRNGAVDFWKQAVLTHPTGNNSHLSINLPSHFEDSKQAVEQIASEMRELVKKDLGEKAGSGQGLSEKAPYRKSESDFAPARFHYLFFLLRRRLARENVGGLGALWHRMPADTRLPDHSIWQHNGLVSALASCKRLSGQASLMVFSISPVQDFVGRARKLRDYWSGSLILSWLAFEGIKAVVYEYGADHMVYPSLHGQPLIDGLLRDWKMEDEWIGKAEDKAGVASFPNKFVCLVPAGEEDNIAAAIKEAVTKKWLELGEATRFLLERKTGRKDPYVGKQFDRQLNNYWECNWAAVPLVSRNERREIEELLHEETIEETFRALDESIELLKGKGVVQTPGSEKGRLYSISHRLAQAMLAAGKTHRRDRREPEKGIKCDLFGEFEVLHYQEECGCNPKPSKDPFWVDLRNSFSESEFGRTERLCAIALVKRLAYLACREKEMEGHPLQAMFQNADSFPSTTEMALQDWWRQVQARAKSQDDPEAVKLANALACFDWAKERGETILNRLAQWYHQLNEPEQTGKLRHEIKGIDPKGRKKEDAARTIFKIHKVKDIHKYYAVLMMDGDRMGKLVNGETLGATWETVLHPDLAGRFQGDFDSDYQKFWRSWLKEKRFISPAVHAAISEALGDFSLYTVPYIIQRKYGGRLLYAGGDDVCAVMPASTVLDAAREIAETYGWGFISASSGEQARETSGRWRQGEGSKLGIHPGKGAEISISAGIMIAHHKKPLGRVMKRAHDLLDIAKNKGGRDAFALEWDKRSGGGRVFLGNWKEKNGTRLLDHFLQTADALSGSEEAAMSSSLAYRLASFEEGLQALIDGAPDQLVPFIVQQLKRSGLNPDSDNDEKSDRLKKVARHVAALISRQSPAEDDEKKKLPLESIIVANFIGHCRNENREDCHG